MRSEGISLTASLFAFLQTEWPAVHESASKAAAAGDAVFNKARVITQLGNQAVHSHRPILGSDALVAVRERFHLNYWLAHTYARGTRPAPGLTFDPAALPQDRPHS